MSEDTRNDSVMILCSTDSSCFEAIFDINYLGTYAIILAMIFLSGMFV